MFTNMLLVFLVIVVVFGAACAVNYNQRVSDVQNAVIHAAQNGLPDREAKRIVPNDDGSDVATMAETGSVGEVQNSDTPPAPATDAAPEDADFKQGLPRMSADDQFVATSTYVLDENGSAATVINDSLELDADVLAQGIDTAWQESVQNERIEGRVDQLNLYYCINRSDDKTTVAFASGNYVDQNMMSLMLSLGGACALALIAFFGISVWLSRWALRPVERAWVQQQQFVADASHELKTPLTVILANNSIIASQQQSTVADQMKWIDSTSAEAKLMQGLVNDLLFLAQPEDGEQELQKSDVNFSDVVENVALQFESVAFERNVRLNADIASGITVHGDEARLSRMVSTLIDNACKYVDEGGQIDVGLASVGGHANLTVRNTGEAIDTQDIPHLFDRFWRADKARARETGGFGLGLAISREIAEDHNGTIHVSSSKDEGTTFTVTL